ncbi:concanavalin A-like lectin/glucanase domain-containing protein [Mycena capillaripes]|nr:concanavalin A-like lectin/glucanase domain-containing protein [Mycena capillaripes]
MASNPFSTPPLSRVPTADVALSHLSFASDADIPSTPTKRMASTALPPAAPYAAVAKPWTKKPNPRATFSYYLTWFLLLGGASLGALQSYLTYRHVRLDREPLCMVFSEDFDSGDDNGVFGTTNGDGRWLREVQMDGFGNGQFEMTTGSANNSFLKDGNLYLLPTLTPGAPFSDGTTYNSTDCTFNLTAPNGGFNAGPTGTDFDYAGYFAACSRTTNNTAGTIINPVQSARVSTFISAQSGSEATLSRGRVRYGKVEVRAKMPKGDWLWPAIWMLPVPVDNKTGTGAYGAWPRSGEIDLVESRGNGIRYTNRGSNYVQGALNWGPSPQLNGVGKSYSWWTDRRTPFSNEFHTYTMEWTDKWLRISVDTRLHTLLDLQFKEPFWKRGQFPQTVVGQNGRLEPLDNPWVNGTNATPFDQDFYLIMNVAVGGTNGWFPDGQGDKPWLNQAGSCPYFDVFFLACYDIPSTGDSTSLAALALFGFIRKRVLLRAELVQSLTHPMSDFIKNSAQWLSTWPENVDDRAMVVDYVRMWKHCGDP